MQGSFGNSEEIPCKSNRPDFQHPESKRELKISRTAGRLLEIGDDAGWETKRWETDLDFIV